MSKQINIDLGPRDPGDEERLLRAMIEAAGKDCVVNVRMGALPAKAAVAPHVVADVKPNEQLAQAVGDTVDKSLETKHEQLLPRGQRTPEERAKEIVTAKFEWRNIVNDVGWKIVIETILKGAWEERAALWQTVKDQLGY